MEPRHVRVAAIPGFSFSQRGSLRLHSRRERPGLFLTAFLIVRRVCCLLLSRCTNRSRVNPRFLGRIERSAFGTGFEAPWCVRGWPRFLPCGTDRIPARTTYLEAPMSAAPARLLRRLHLLISAL